MLIGRYQHSLDVKNRVSIPAKFREELGDSFIATRGLDRCIFIYSLAEWEKFDAKLKTLNMTNKDAREFSRMFYANACECEVDKQGRIVIPNNLRSIAKIEKDVMITGVSDRVEIWSLTEWENFENEANQRYEDISENLFAN